MSQHGAISRGNHRFAGGLLLGALASGTLAVASLGSAGVANATCASFSGFHNSGGCETTDPGDIAIGLGPRTTVRASGGLNTSIAVGADAEADAFGKRNTSLAFGNGAFGFTEGARNLAVAVGNSGPNGGMETDDVLVPPSDNAPAQAEADGTGNRAFEFGRGSLAFALDGPEGSGHNTAITIGNGSNGVAIGTNRFGAALGNNRNAENGVNNVPSAP
jgi:hypothetical protein